MNNGYNDDLLKEVARSYADEQGEKLLSELACTTAFDTASLDQKVRQGTIGKKKTRDRRVLWSAAILAASILLAVWIPGLFPTLPPAHSDESPAEKLPPSEDSYEVIPLTAELPSRLSVADMRQDRGQTIYYLKDEYQDDVVVTLEKDNGNFDSEGLHTVEIGRKTAYYRSTEDYRIIAFEHNGTLYTATSRYEIDILFMLSEEILKT